MRLLEALGIREKIEAASAYIPDARAYDVKWFFPKWTADGHFTTGKVWEFNTKLYKCRQDHDGQEDYTPDRTPALWELVPDPTEDGTREHPISYNAGMALENGKYYTQYAELYLCTRDTENPVYNDLRDLVGLYVEVAT